MKERAFNGRDWQVRAGLGGTLVAVVNKEVAK